MPDQRRRRLLTALGSIATLGVLAGCAETDEDDDGMGGGEEGGEEEEEEADD